MLPRGSQSVRPQGRFPLSRARPERLGRRDFPRATRAVFAAALLRAERRRVLLRALGAARFLAGALTGVAAFVRRGARRDAGAPSACARRRVTSSTSPSALITRSRTRAR